MEITTIGLDLAKNVFQVHGVNARGKAVLRKQLKRDQVAAFFANLPVCLIGIEACASAHHWARKLQALGHTVRLMAPQFVKPYVKSNKNDAADAEAICEAVSRPSMRFVPVKNVEQQAVLSLHRVRQGFVKARTAQGNQIRGLLGEYGLVVPQGDRLHRSTRAGTDRRCGERAARLLPAAHPAAARAPEGVAAAGRRDRGADQGVAPRQRSEPASGEGAGHRAVDRDRPGGQRRRREKLRQRTAVRGMAGRGAAAALQRRQADAAGHEQAR